MKGILSTVCEKSLYEISAYPLRATLTHTSRESPLCTKSVSLDLDLSLARSIHEDNLIFTWFWIQSPTVLMDANSRGNGDIKAERNAQRPSMKL